MENIKGKTALITGASSGIGEACAWAFARAGARLVLCARSTEKLTTLKKQIKKKVSASEVHIVSFDVRKKKEVYKSIDQLPKKFSNIEILINNAGLALGKEKFQECSVEDWDVMIDTNIKGLLYVSHVVVQKMVKQKYGTIINIGSVAGREVYPAGNIYCATKAAVHSISDAMRIDLLDSNIRVCTIQPGKVRTGFSLVRYKGDKDKSREAYEGYTPLEAQDVADGVLYVASRPSHVQIAELYILPTDQASARDVDYKQNAR